MEPDHVDNPLDDNIDGPPLPKQIRHINCLQVCNFTPFPVRDAVTSALSQPVEPSQLSTLSHLSDNLDLSSRRRSRKPSTTSINTKSSGRRDDDDTSSFSLEIRGRKISLTHGSLTNRSSESNASPPGIPRISYGSPQTIRRRGRANSVASSMSEQVKAPSVFSQGVSFPMTGSSFSTVFPDISQQGLETIIDSRLIETFLAITIPPTNVVTPVEPFPKKTPVSSHGPDSRKSSIRHNQSSSVSSLPLGTPSSRGRTVSGTVKSLPSKLKSSHSKSSSTPVYQPNDNRAGSSSRQHSPPPPNPIPDYLSPIYRPSVNPTFPIDARPGQDFLASSNTNSGQLKVQLWGRSRGISDKVVGKQKRPSLQGLFGVTLNSNWAVMQEWEFGLNDLLPLPQQISQHALDLPPNTLLVTLNPPGKTYYLPSLQTPLPRPESPSLGYSSDPEITSKRMKRDDFASDSTVIPLAEPSTGGAAGSRIGHYTSLGTNTPAKSLTHSYPQLFELVNLQSLIRDHEMSLSVLIQKIDKYFEEDRIFPLRREISERHYRLETLHAESKMVVEETAARKKELEHRRKKLEERKRLLVSARILEEANISDTADLVQEVEEERERLKDLHAKFNPKRISLLSTLASIYPIELYSLPDLLYTILDVPLPIPSTATDPAPPLSLPNHPNVNEDAIATSLGYVAQLLQLLAAYLGQPLIYPVTCVGSRSFIKDGISAMMGPRMFPLFPKGVDTYRFEYGVFLLNKDIEMFMVDRDLRALDVRHTLPNLKNLVLIVTHGEVAPVSRKPPPDSPPLSMLGLDSSMSGESLSDIGSITPKTKKLDLEPPEADDPSTPPASGSTTPVVAAVDEKKSRPFLGVSLSGLLRGRYPSTSRTSVKSVPGGLDGGQPQTNESDLNELISGMPEAGSDHVEEDIKPSPPGSLEQAPPDAQYEDRSNGREGLLAEGKLDGLGAESETTSVHVH